MTRLIDHLDALVIHASSRDGRIAGALKSNGDVEIWFLNPDHYYDYTAIDLSRQLTELLRGLQAKRIKNVKQTLDIENPNMSLWDARQRLYQEKLAELTSCGMTRQGVVEVSAIGALGCLQVDVDPDALHELDIEDFLVEFHAAYEDMLRDFRAQRRELKRQAYGR